MEKDEPIIESERKRRNQPRIFEWFEYLSNEMQKRERKDFNLQSSLKLGDQR